MNQFTARKRPITFSWRLLNSDGEPFSLQNYDYRLVYYTGRGTSGPITTTLSGEGHNVLNWVMTTAEQIQEGVYSMRLEVFFRGQIYCTVRYQDAFMLVEVADTRSYNSRTRDNEEKNPFSVTLWSTVAGTSMDHERIADEVLDVVDERASRQRYMRIAQSRGGLLLYGEEEIVTVTIIDGLGRDKTDEYSRFSLRRESGDEASDNVWNARHGDVGTQFIIGTTDLNINYTTHISNIFTVTGYGRQTVNGQIVYNV